MSYSDANIQLDFFADWIEILCDALRALGYDVPADDADVERGYFNFLKRRVPQVPRTVHVARELVCPSEHDAGYRALMRKVRDGNDVRANLSTRLTNLDFNDGLLNDWGIHHVHLGTTVDARGFVNRTGPLLFARFTVADAFFIAIGPHGAFADLQLVEILERNWPEQVPMLPGIASRSGTNPTSAEIAQARRDGVVALVNIGGRVVFPMGGGVTTARVGADVVSMMDRARTAIRGFEDDLAARAGDLSAELTAAGVSQPVRLRLRASPDGRAFATTDCGKIVWPLGRLVGSSPYSAASWPSSSAAARRATPMTTSSTQQERNRRKAQRRRWRDAARK
jgi:hypothetical protein